MNLQFCQQQLERHLLTQLERFGPRHEFSDIYEYSLVPAGKLFRPMLCLATAHDHLKINFNEQIEDPFSPLSLLANALEIHHVYTLLHDDMPCMDNDLERRGRAATHVKFGQWQALLAGDGLQGLSYMLLSQTNAKNIGDILKLFSWGTGPKGLIHGQTLDLSEQMNDSWANLLQTHLLKTARLIQLSLTLPLYLGHQVDTKDLKSKWRLGESMGLSFQFLDDFTELTERELPEHELRVNPWLQKEEQSLNFLMGHLDRVHELSHELPATKAVLGSYYQKMENKIESGAAAIKEHLNGSDQSIQKLLGKIHRINHR
jgi:geranylgeranyl pyrophosphate synthase